MGKKTKDSIRTYVQRFRTTQFPQELVSMHLSSRDLFTKRQFAFTVVKWPPTAFASVCLRLYPSEFKTAVSPCYKHKNEETVVCLAG